MDLSHNYGTALQYLDLASRLELTDEGWATFTAAATALAEAAATDDLEGIQQATGCIALLSNRRAKSRSDPKVKEQPRRAREAAGYATEVLKARTAPRNGDQ